ncbi:MAG: hypothetical protein O3C40_35530 [Planctomycetota bacterium]|nr:hypothetical protein [Planctomycetota bacterium]
MNTKPSQLAWQISRSAIRLGTIVLCTSLVLVPAVIQAETSQAWVEENVESLVELYRHFYAHPELSFQEEQTSERLARELAEVGAEVTKHVGGFGVVGLLRNGAGPTLMLRTDLDALPVVEQTALVFASTVKDAADAEPSMGREDFSRHVRAGVPILMIRLGAVDRERLKRYEQLGQAPPSLHSPLFFPDIEDALKTSVPTMSEAAIELLKRND